MKPTRSSSSAESFWHAVLRKESGADRAAAKYARDKAKKLAEWEEHPWAWLSGTDLSGRPLIWTKDEHDEERPIKHYPAQKGDSMSAGLERVVELLWTERFLSIDKARQMLISTTCSLTMDWHVRFRQARRWVLSKHKEELATLMLTDKIRFADEKLPDWVRAAHRLLPRPAGKLIYEVTGGLIHAAAENAASSILRGITATGVFCDEASFQDSLASIVGAAVPMAERIWLVSTPGENPGSPGSKEWDRILGMKEQAQREDY